MVAAPQAPNRGDIIWISLTPQAGHEQRGRRPALVLSPVDYNSKVHLALLCPITNQVKGYPFEVALPDGLPITGVVLADQIKSLDWTARDTEVVARAPESVVAEVCDRLALLLDPESE